MKTKSKYEEALERAKQGLPIDEIFPELKEGEDERIRKAISYAICSATHQDGTLINGVTKEEALAYLEKQKKPSTDYLSTNNIKTLSDGTTVRYTIGYIAKQKEFDWDDELERCKKYTLYFHDKYVKTKLNPKPRKIITYGTDKNKTINEESL